MIAPAHVRRQVFTAARARWPRQTMAVADLLYTRLFPFEPELPVLARMLARLPRPGLGVDVGANAGLFSAFLARNCDQVIAVEPNPDEAVYLRRWLPANVRVLECALSDTQGNATLFVPGAANGLPLTPLASVQAERSEETGRVGPMTSLPVRLTRLDDVLAGWSGPPLTLLKVDVEGHEAKVLAGAQDSLSRYRPVVMAEHSGTRHDGAELMRQMKDQGYEPFRVIGGRLQRLSSAENLPQVNALHACNLIFLHPGPHHDFPGAA